MTIHEKLMLARHLERAARAYNNNTSASIIPDTMEQNANEALEYATLLRSNKKAVIHSGDG